ncbi:MAG: ATP-binding protein [Burkholderiales bacterium]
MQQSTHAMPDSNTPSRAQRRTLVLVWLAAMCLIALAWWHVLTTIAESKARELTVAQTELANLTRVSQEHAIRTFRGADQVIRFIQARYLEVGPKLDLAALVRQGVIDAEIFPQVGVIDAKGMYAVSNIVLKAPLDLSDREHFKVHVAADTGQLFISKPIIGRASGKWSVQLTRRINRANGEFAGVVVVSIDPGYFTRFYGELQLGSGALAALYGVDGIARARMVGTMEEFGTDASGGPIIQRLQKGELEGTQTSASKVDGVERIYHFRKIPQYPLAVFMGKELSQVLTNHNHAREDLLRQVVMLTLLVLTLAAVITRYLMQVTRALEVQRLARNALQKQAGQLNEIFELSPDGFVSFGVDKRINYVSPAFARMTDQGATPLVGLDEHGFSHWLNSLCEAGTSFDGLSGLRGAADAAHEGDKHAETDAKTITLKGNKVLQLALRSSASATVSQVLHLRDVTREFEIDQIKSEFLSTAAHELRTPMASILGFSELLITQPFDEDQKREFLDIIYRQSIAVAAILDELLDLARIESRRGKDFTLTRFDLNELVSQTVGSYLCPQGRELPVVVPAAQPQWLLGDAGKLRQAILNVLSNAYKYSPQGGPVRIEVDALLVRGQLPQARIRVTDRGIGMTPEQTSKVWDRFYRVDTSGRFPGTGLGMSIVKEIVGLHHGSVSISSALGQGTCVSLCLPVDSSKA